MNKLALTTTAILLATSFSTTAMALTYAEALESCSDCDLRNRATSNHADNKDLNTGQYLYNDANGNTIGIMYARWRESETVFNVNVVYNAYLNKSFVYTCTRQAECNSPSVNQFVFLCEGTCYPTYDDNAHLSTLTYLDSTTGRTILGKEEYTYDSESNLTQKMTYDSNGNLTQKITYDIDGNPTGTETFAYDSDGDLTQKISYDANGNPISTENYALKIYTAEQAYAATSKGNHNSISIRIK